jgi:polar amino acid transport system substrate-binding protein
MVSFAALAANAQTRELTVGWEDNPPLQMSVQGTQMGIDMDIARAMVEGAGLKIRFEKLPWARQLVLLQSGGLDIAMSASMTDDRKPYALWTTAYRSERTSLFALASKTIKVKNLSQLLGGPARIGIMRGSSFPGEFETLKDNSQFKALLYPTISNASSLAMLRAKRLDYVIEDQLTFSYLAQIEPGEKVAEASLLSSEDVYFMLSKKSLAKDPELLQKLNLVIDRMKKTGEIGRIFKRYNVKP